MGNKLMEEYSAVKEYERPADRRRTYSFILSRAVIVSVEELCLCENISVAAALQYVAMNPEFIMAGVQMVAAKRTDDDHCEFQVSFSSPSK